MDIPTKLYNDIVEFFLNLPNLHGSDGRRALLSQAGVDAQLHHHIKCDTPSAEFFPLFVNQLHLYGKLQDGRYALEAVLEEAKKHIGTDKQRECEILQKVYTYIIRQSSSQNTQDLQTENEKLRTENDKLQIENDKLQIKNKELQIENDKLQTENDKLQTKDEELQTKDEELQTKNEELQTKNDKLQKYLLKIKTGGKICLVVLVGLLLVLGIKYLFGYISPNGKDIVKPPTPTVRLRSKPIKIHASEKNDVFDLNKENFPNKYIEHVFDKEEVVLDYATGLIWKKSGSDKRMIYKEALEYVEELNQRQFARYNTWRLPTIPELLSLLEKEMQSKSRYINPFFEVTRGWYWSADKCFADEPASWTISFYEGEKSVVQWKNESDSHFVLAVCSLEKIPSEIPTIIP